MKGTTQMLSRPSISLCIHEKAWMGLLYLYIYIYIQYINRPEWPWKDGQVPGPQLSRLRKNAHEKNGAEEADEKMCKKYSRHLIQVTYYFLGPGSAYSLILCPGTAHWLILGPGTAHSLIVGPGTAQCPLASFGPWYCPLTNSGPWYCPVPTR